MREVKALKIKNTLEGFILDRHKKEIKDNLPDTYEVYKRKNGIFDSHGYADAINKLYFESKKDLASYGINSRKISNKGLQNSGYASYIDALSNKTFWAGRDAIKQAYSEKENEHELGYLAYLEKYKKNEDKLGKNVLSHLVKNGVVDLELAVAYGMSAGLSKEAAENIGKSAYELTKKKVFNSILEQTVKLGLDSEGAKLLAMKMGISESDAQGFSEEIQEILDHYRNVSEEYLEYLEQRTN